MLFDDYLQELELAKGKDAAKAYGRTKGKKRAAYHKNVYGANKKIYKASRVQKKIDRRLGRLKYSTPELRQKQLKKLTKLHKKQARLTKQGEKLYSKTIGAKKVKRVLSKKKPQIGRVASLKKFGKLGLAVGAVAGAGYVGSKTYKRIKDRRNEGMSISINELRDEIIYEMYEEDLDEGGVLRVASKLLRSGKGATSTSAVASKAGKVGKMTKYGKAMGPLGIAFDIMFIFELGSMAYKRFFSKAAKACKGSPDRKVCYRRYKVGAKQVQVKTLRSKIGMCSKHKTPDKCKARVMNKINNLQSDIKFLKQEI